MKNKLLVISLLLMVVTCMVMGQGTTMTIGTVTAPATGTLFSVPVNVASFTNVGSITLKIAYDTAVVTYSGVANAPAGVNFANNASGGVITLIWYDASGSTPINIPSGKLLDINFTYKNGTGSVAFNSSQCEVTNSAGSVIGGITYLNGAINGVSTTIKISIDSVSAPAGGGAFSVPVRVANFSNVGSITLKIAYSQTVATFTGIANSPAGVNFANNASNGVITLIWYDASGNTPLTLASGKLVDLNFTYIGGLGPVTFNSVQCEVTNASGTAISGISYVNGNINIASANSKPVFTPIAAITKAEKDTVRFVVSATDPNPGDVLTYSASGLPTGATFTAATRTFLWVPSLGQNGSYTVKFLVSDGQLTDSTNASITITKTNVKPVLSSIAAITKVEKDTVRFVVSATDPNPGDVLTYSASGLPTGATFTAATRTFLWVPSVGQNGSYTVKFLVSDGQLTDSTNAVITITKANVKPTFNPIAAITKAEKDTVRFVVSATDPNTGDVLTYTVSSLPTGAVFTAATRTFLWVPSLGQNGSYTVKFLVSDGQLTDSTSVVITVTKLNMAVLNPIADKTLDDAPIAHRTIKVKLTAPAVFTNNAGVLTFTATSSNSAIAAATIITPDTLQVKGFKAGGPVVITVTAKDIDNSQISTTFNVTVTGSTGVENETNIPTDFSVSQNYPNPFNPSTKISYALPADGHVVLRVFNMLGQAVATLVDGNSIAGSHVVTFTAGNSMPSGVYIYELKYKERVSVNKMILMK